MTSDVMIEARGLTKRYGAFRALDRVSFEVKKGEVVGFLGPNGAGKSTTMRILTCYQSATGGTATVHGFDVFDDPLEVRKKIGYLPQRAQMYGEMGVLEYLRFVAEIRHIETDAFTKRIRGVVEVCGLGTVLGKDLRQLSHGYRQRVGLAQALIHDPPILVLDEPTEGLDPNEKTEVIEYIKQIGRDRTVILSTHNLAEVEEACARAIIISKGRVVADGSIDDVRARGGRVRYEISIDEKNALGGKGAPVAAEVERALAALDGITAAKEVPTDDKAHAFSLLGTKGSDLRAEIFRLCVERGWILLEMRREIQKLEDVFKALTKSDELADRLRAPAAAAAAEDDEEGSDEEGSDEEGSDEEGSDDEDGDDEGSDDDASDDDAAAAKQSGKKG